MAAIKNFFIAIILTVLAIVVWFSSIIIGYFLAIVGGIALAIFSLFSLLSLLRK